jgi:hypothetical protein
MKRWHVSASIEGSLNQHLQLDNNSVCSDWRLDFAVNSPHHHDIVEAPESALDISLLASNPSRVQASALAK